MFKWIVGVILLVPMSVFANSSLIGKWQCEIKDNTPDINQNIELQFFKDGTVNETFQIRYGQKTDYTYQIETAHSKANWHLDNETLIYDNYQLYHYKVRMPNSQKDDIEQAGVALNKSLPIIEMMIKNEIHQRVFDVSFVNKRYFLANDNQSQMLMTCHKKGWFGF